MMEKVDRALQAIHQFIADTSYRYLGLSHYAVSKIITVAGILAMQTAVGIFALDFVLYQGSMLTAVLAVAVDILYTTYYSSNLNKARVAKVNEAFLIQQSLYSVIPFETKLQQSYFSVTVKSYISAMLFIPSLAIVTGGLDSPLKIAGMAALLFATACIYNARYMLQVIPRDKATH